MKSQIWTTLLFFLFILFSFGYSLLMPMWEAPDEPAHYQYILHIVENGQLPTYEHTSEAGQPPLYYLFASIPISILQKIDEKAVEIYLPPSLLNAEDRTSPRVFDWNPDNFRILPGPLLLRWVNIGIGFWAVFFVYQGAKIYTQGNRLVSVSTAALYGLTPQFLHMSAVVNNDTLAFLNGAVLFWVSGLILTREIAPNGLILVGGLAFIIPFFIKFTAVPAGLVVAIISGIKLLPHLHTKQRKMLALGTCGMFITILAWALFATRLGDRMLFELEYRLGMIRNDIITPQLPTQVLYLFWSYWGQIGWVRIGLPIWQIMMLTSLAILGLMATFRQSLLFSFTPGKRLLDILVPMAGAMILLATLLQFLRFVPEIILGLFLSGLILFAGGLHFRRLETESLPAVPLLHWKLIWLLAFMGCAALFRNFMTTEQLQGRFVFPSAGAISLLIVYGWNALMAKYREQVRITLLFALMIGLNLVMWFTQVIPIFYQPFLD